MVLYFRDCRLEAAYRRHYAELWVRLREPFCVTLHMAEAFVLRVFLRRAVVCGEPPSCSPRTLVDDFQMCGHVLAARCGPGV
ncbi:hypothetical protein WJX81_001309 [Elliptochloris bilobata]|uniref:Uncharacterized protein n=1 Tax=Elliptochloris bilobata TaxID=381761 RepID=A0AAW1RST3_9CHLO